MNAIDADDGEDASLVAVQAVVDTLKHLISSEFEHPLFFLCV